MKQQKTTNTLKRKVTSLNPTSSLLNSVNVNKHLEERLLEATDKQHQEMSRAIKLKEINLILESRLHLAVTEAMSRHRSRSPLLRSPAPSRKDRLAEIKERGKYEDCDALHLQNIPKEWGHVEVRDFLTDVAGVPQHIHDEISWIRILKDENFMPKGECLLIMPNSEMCKKTCDKMSGFSVEGKQIYVMRDKVSSFQQHHSKKRPLKNITQNPKPHFQPAFEPNNPNMYETFGLSKSFLNSLGINPPLLNTIFIGNLENSVEEPKLREVFSHAGQVLSVLLIRKNPKKLVAKVEFDHPVEAVQAISMFHKQELYNRPMLIQLDQSPRGHKYIPEGLSGIGPGLGDKGEPLRGVRNALELQPFKQFLTQEVEKLKSKDQKADLPNKDNTNMAMPINMPFANPFTSFNSPNVSSNNLMTSLNSLLNNQGMQNYQALQNLLQQNIGNDLLSYAAFSQNPAQNMIGFNSNVAVTQPTQVPRVHNNQVAQIASVTKLDSFGGNYGTEPIFNDNRINFDRGQINDSMRNNAREDFHRESAEDAGKSTMTSTDMLVFTNLPSSVTLPALKAKMQEVGDLKFAEMTSQGRAIVRFSNVEDASRCVRILYKYVISRVHTELFDRSKVDGQTIDVKFF